ncbi:MAG: hypothetical protein MUC49_11570 [Raineya sp.]|jgi:uncharacterized membrane protein HdeD (DUF308 family)|nr:hypothetical protein [Raineya sp.]
MKITDLEKILWIVVGIIEAIFLYLQFASGATLPIWNLIITALVAYAIYNRFKGKPVSESERSSELGVSGIIALMSGYYSITGGFYFLNVIETVLAIALLVIGFKNMGQGEKKSS